MEDYDYAISTLEKLCKSQDEKMDELAEELEAMNDKGDLRKANIDAHNDTERAKNSNKARIVQLKS